MQWRSTRAVASSTGHDDQGRSIVISDATAKERNPNPSDPDRGHIKFLENGIASPPAMKTMLTRWRGRPLPWPRPGVASMFRFFQIAPEKNEASLTKEERDKAHGAHVRGGPPPVMRG